MKFYLNYINVLKIGIIGFLILIICSSCQVFKSNTKMLTITEASYCKTFGGQGRSRSMNFELSAKESLAQIDAIYWLEIDGFKVDLKLHHELNQTKLVGFYNEYRSSREVNFDENSLFDKEPFTDIILKISKTESTEDISIKTIENKPTKYYP